MHYVIRRLQHMQKYMFSVTCPDVLCLRSSLGPPEHERYYIDISHLGHTRPLYVIHRSHQMQKYKFTRTCPLTHFMGSVPGPLEQHK
jgi:hypothetical protein